MEKESRNAIEKATQRARKLLEDDFTSQLEGTFDVLGTGHVAEEGGAHLSKRQLRDREKIVAAIEHRCSTGMSPVEAVLDYVRDAAFTTLNRCAALKMLEARGLVQPCITRGEESSGFREYCGLAPGVSLLPNGVGYRLYLESLYDELSTEVKVLFDRSDSASVLWPKRQTFDALLALVNAPELSAVWGEDETIGWVYQYFNTSDERREMRDASPAAPRNAYELAVRNQFFTPRYIVQFLTDNTLGRVWCEMREGNSLLTTRCQYLVRPDSGRYASRPRKDPRDIRVLDPACGSGHFLLYAFELFLTMYDEAWEDEQFPASEHTGQRLREDYGTREDLRRAAPELILRHNLFGVDVDPRCAQIAQLALWMRARRSLTEAGVDPSHRNQINRVNVVIAESAVTDALPASFADMLPDPFVRERFQLLSTSLDIAGELGFLLRLETIERATQEARPTLFGPSDEVLRSCLERYLAESGPKDRSQRRLFRDDALRGLGLLEACEQTYDVVLMNPPFGGLPPAAHDYVQEHYPDEKNDVYACFVARALELLVEGGEVGQITSSTGFTLGHLSRFRAKHLLAQGRLRYLADLGSGVLDGATVKTAAYVISKSPAVDTLSWVDLRAATDKATALSESLSGRGATQWHTLPLHAFEELPGNPIAYGLLPHAAELLAKKETLIGAGIDVNVGMMTGNDFRFLRGWWEVADPLSSSWTDYEKGNGYARFLADPVVVVRTNSDSAEVAADVAAKYGSASRFIMNRHRYGSRGLVYTRITNKGFSIRFMLPGQIFSGAGLAVFSPSGNEYASLCGILNSRVVEHSLRTMSDARKWEAGYVRNAPCPRAALGDTALKGASEAAASEVLKILSLDETTRFFSTPPIPRVASDLNAASMAAYQRALERLDERSLAIFDVTDEEAEAINADVGSVEDWIARESFLLDEMTAEDRWRCYLIGSAFGRWKPPDEPGGRAASWDELWEQGLPRTAPLAATEWNGKSPILVDDEGHRDDIASAMCDRADAHGVSIDVREMRRWLRASAFEIHLSQYSRSRRKAPIYWRLSTSSGGYSVWLYFHGLTKDTLYKALHECIEPKLQYEQRLLESLREGAGASATSTERKQIAAQQSAVDELRTLLEEVNRVAPLWNPDLEDGVVINFALLWRLVPRHKAWQKELSTIWKALSSGELDWAHLAMRLWPERVVLKCQADRSLAIAHGLEDVFWVKDAHGKWAARVTPTRSVDELVDERTSRAVKAALQDLLDAPIVAASRGRRNGRRGVTKAEGAA